LVQGRDGNFYGTTESGLTIYSGTVFKMTPAGDITTLFTFMATNGYYPTAGLTLGNNGNFYGTTSGSEDDSRNPTTVFKITPDGALTTLAVLDHTNDASYTPGLTLGSDGNLYGTAQCGPGLGMGTAFKVTPSGELTMLARFTNGAVPNNGEGNNFTGVVQGPDGNLYGTLYSFGTNPPSSVYQMTFAGVITTVAVLPSPPTAGPIFGRDGCLYGASANLIYRVVPPPMLQSVSTIGGGVTLTWSAAIGQKYQPQFATNLSSTNWNGLGAPITATNLTITVSDSAVADTQRFYRVQLLP
jgi:uncharacterized repeat protein (TIGR03803 family)